MRYFFVVVPFLGGKPLLRQMGYFVVFWEGFTIFWVVVWVGLPILDKLEFSSTPYLFTLEKCQKEYDSESQDRFIKRVITQKEIITALDLKDIILYEHSEKYNY